MRRWHPARIKHPLRFPFSFLVPKSPETKTQQIISSGSLGSWRNVDRTGNRKDHESRERVPSGKELEKLGDGASKEGGEEGEIGSEQRSRQRFNGR